ncbi:MAG: hypothetical protein K2X47_03870 [Bdellovibrionales bacterium]|nr:hypothetical protein [Bdellovibrionales bacterium]
MSAQKLQIVSEGQQTEHLVLQFSGAIDELAEFPTLALEGFKSIVFDLEKVKSLNSIGIRNWVIWRKTIPSKVQITFRFVPKVVIDQMNILDGFLPFNSLFESFQVPFHCEDCDLTTSYLFTKGRDFEPSTADFQGEVKTKVRPCPECSAETEPDVFEGTYFSFLKKNFRRK